MKPVPWEQLDQIIEIHNKWIGWQMARKEPFVLVNGFILTEEQTKCVRAAVPKLFEESEGDQRTSLREVLRAMGFSWRP